MNQEETLSPSEQAGLRSRGLTKDNEVAVRVGDILVAENVITRERRVIEAAPMSESARRILKG